MKARLMNDIKFVAHIAWQNFSTENPVNPPLDLSWVEIGYILLM